MQMYIKTVGFYTGRIQKDIFLYRKGITEKKNFSDHSA